MKKLLFYLILLVGLNGYSQIINVANGLNLPHSIFIDGNDLYVPELNSNKITKFDASLINQPLGTTFATGTNIPSGFARYGNYLYVAKSVGPSPNDKIVRIDLTIPNSLPTDFLTEYPDINGINHGLDMGNIIVIGNYMYITDYTLHGILKVDLTQNNPIPSIVVTGINTPYGLASKGNDLYISEWDNGNVSNNYSSIYKIDVSQTNPALSTVISGIGSVPSIAIKCDYLFFNEANDNNISYINLTQPNPVKTVLLNFIVNHSLAIKDDFLYFDQYGYNEVSKINVSSVVNVIPIFPQIAPICSGAALNALPSTSNNNIIGTWSPALNNLATTTYTFTPDAGQCATTTTMTIVVNLNCNTVGCWKSVSLGDLNTLAIRQDGTLWTWGSNASGILGTAAAVGIAGSNLPIQIGIDSDWSFIAVGNYHSIAIKTNGTLWSWGWNQYYQLGLGHTNYTDIPTQVGTDTDWKTATALYGHTLAIKNNGTLWAWGENTYGAVGNGNFINQTTPVQIPGFNWSDITAGDEHSLALDTFGNLYAWGWNHFGQLGNGSTITTNSPILSGQTPNGSQWKSISGSTYKTFGVLNDGTLWTWGDGQTTPLQLGSDTDWKKISSTYYNNGYLALKNDNTLWIYDIGIPGTQSNPQQVGLDNNWLEIATRTNNYAGIKTDGSLWVWGSNTFGQIGNGTNTDSNVPISIGCTTLPCTTLITPTFTQISPICSGTIISTLPTISTNAIGITGTWSPALNNLATTTYTFTPDAGQCATAKTMTIVVNPLTTNTTTITECESYYWSINGVTYTTSGTYTIVNGCTTEILNLTILPLIPWYYDGDGDGYGLDFWIVQLNCTQPTGYVSNNTDCNDNNATVYPGAIEICYDALDNDCDGTIDEGCIPVVSRVIPAQCGMPLLAINTTVLATIPNATPAVTRYRFRVTKLISGIPSTNPADVQVYTPVITSLFPYAFKITQLPLFAYGTTYKIEVSVEYLSVWQPYGVACNVSTPSATSSVISPSCGSTLTTMGDVITATIVNDIKLATYFPASSIIKPWRFQVTNLTTLSSEVFYNQLRSFKISDLPSSFVRYGTTYKIEVAFLNRDNSWSAYGLPCTITTPQFPRTQIVSGQCGSTAISGSQLIYADIIPTSIATVSQYTFRITNATLSYSQTKDNNLRSFYLNQFPGLLPNTTYNVEVCVKIGSVVGPYGNLCTITTPAVFRTVATTEILNTTIFDVVVYPNPFTDKVNLKIDTPSKESITINVYDMLGKLLETREIAINISEIELGANYPSGVYNVIVTQSENSKNVRIIKR